MIGPDNIEEIQFGPSSHDIPSDTRKGTFKICGALHHPTTNSTFSFRPRASAHLWSVAGNGFSVIPVSRRDNAGNNFTHNVLLLAAITLPGLANVNALANGWSAQVVGDAVNYGSWPAADLNVSTRSQTPLGNATVAKLCFASECYDSRRCETGLR